MGHRVGYSVGPLTTRMNMHGRWVLAVPQADTDTEEPPPPQANGSNAKLMAPTCAESWDR